jgi:uncharacterized protein (DUF305 family)
MVDRAMSLPPAPDGGRRPSALQLAAAALVLVFFGGAVTYFVIERRDHPPGRASVDVGFLHDMITHHEQALQMANIQLGAGATDEVMPFAREILLFQSYEIGLMEQKLAGWGHSRADRPETAMGWMPGNGVAPEAMPGMASAAELDALVAAEGAETDALFVPLMQDHHRGGLHMAEYAAAEADDAWVRALAARIARNQRSEVAELEAARERAGLAKDPPGYEPDLIPGDDHRH